MSLYEIWREERLLDKLEVHSLYFSTIVSSLAPQVGVSISKLLALRGIVMQKSLSTTPASAATRGAEGLRAPCGAGREPQSCNSQTSPVVGGSGEKKHKWWWKQWHKCHKGGKNCFVIFVNWITVKIGICSERFCSGITGLWLWTTGLDATVTLGKWCIS